MIPEVARLGPVSQCFIGESDPPCNKQLSSHGARPLTQQAGVRELRLTARLPNLFAIAFAAAAALSAQQGPEYDPDGLPGYVDSVFHHSNFDSVNLYNGQLTIPIALGPSYPVGPKLKYQATLIYTSKLDEFGYPDTDDPSFTYRNYIGDPALGLGWSLSTGAIKDCGGKQFRVLCYIGPGGAQHTFTTQPSTGWYKTKDGSQLLLHDLGASGFEMWDGDGNKYSFTWQVTDFDDVITGSNIIYVHAFGKGRNGWYVTTVTDPHGNAYTVEYYDNSDGDTNPCWEHSTPCPATKMYCPTDSDLKSWIPKAIILPTGTIDIELNADNMIEKFKFPVIGGTQKTWTLAYSSYVQECRLSRDHIQANPAICS